MTALPQPPKVLVIGGGWAGLAAAITATQQGAQVSLWDMAPTLGGRAKSFNTPEGPNRDNGQHVLIGAYTECLRLLRLVGLAPEQVLLRTPLDLRFGSGEGLRLPDTHRGFGAAVLRGLAPWLPAQWLSQLPLAVGLWRSGQGPSQLAWRWQDRWGLMSASRRWQSQAWQCPAHQTVADLCTGLPPRIVHDLIEPLCLSALNTPLHRASGAVFLRVLQEALMGPLGASDLLIPKVPLSALWPEAAQAWLRRHGAQVQSPRRAMALHFAESAWQVSSTAGTDSFDQIILACPPQEAARLLPQGIHPTWLNRARALRFEAIATVYVQVEGVPLGPHWLPRPLVALRTNDQAPAQFALDRGQLGGPAGELALVVSACPPMDRERLTQAVLAQAQQLLKAQGGARQGPHPAPRLRPLQTLVEKRATFACTPALQRPGLAIGPGLWACGDYVEGPFPATLEGAVRSGVAAAQQAHAARRTSSLGQDPLTQLGQV